jgi:hypothetical protein
MHSVLPLLALVLATSICASSSFAYGLCDLIGCPDEPCGCCGGGCYCEADCGCEPCGDCCCEASCGCEPSCGCGGECCCDGRQFAGQTYDCCCESYAPWCPCTGPECCNTCCEPCGCGSCCEPCCSEPCCGCEPSCGCDSCCDPCCGPRSEPCCAKHCGFGRLCWEAVDALSNCCCTGGCGCSEEVYWSEWHNDPPRCCDPCDCYGNWTGPGNGPYRAPYAHAYSPHDYSGGAYVASKTSAAAYGQYAHNKVNRSSYAKGNARNAPRQQNVARQSQPSRARSQVAHTRGAAAIVIRR